MRLSEQCAKIVHRQQRESEVRGSLSQQFTQPMNIVKRLNLVFDNYETSKFLESAILLSSWRPGSLRHWSTNSANGATTACARDWQRYIVSFRFLCEEFFSTCNITLTI